MPCQNIRSPKTWSGIASAFKNQHWCNRVGDGRYFTKIRDRWSDHGLPGSDQPGWLTHAPILSTPWPGSFHLIPWSRILSGAPMKTSEAWQDKRETDRRLVPVWLCFGSLRGNRKAIHRHRIIVNRNPRTWWKELNGGNKQNRFF